MAEVSWSLIVWISYWKVQPWFREMAEWKNKQANTYLLVLQRTQWSSWGPSWQLATYCNSSIRVANILCLVSMTPECLWYYYIHSEKIHKYIKYKQLYQHFYKENRTYLSNWEHFFRILSASYNDIITDHRQCLGDSVISGKLSWFQ